MISSILKKTLKGITETPKGIVSTASNISETTLSFGNEILDSLSEAGQVIQDISVFDGLIEAINENKEKLFSGLENQFIEKTKFGHETFQKMKNVSEQIVSNVGDNIDELQGKKGEAFKFINEEIKKSNISIISDIDLENGEQEEIANFMLIMVGIGVLIMFPALIPEIIGAIIDPIDIMQLILSPDLEK